MLDCKPVDTPMDPNVKLVPSQGELLRDPGKYRRLVGKLNYLTITRPDISFLVSVVSQFLQSPCDSHWDQGFQRRKRKARRFCVCEARRKPRGVEA